MVHVAAVDAPVTQADVKAIAREAWKAWLQERIRPRKLRRHSRLGICTGSE